uniref:Protein kinase domain-containing protein n=2 Tax=Physcomitrium patens TaxID=3218 RepID=A0A7I4A9G8_PHYPA
MAKSVYKSIFSHMATAEYADTPKQFLKLTKECSERTQKMTTPSAFSSPPKVNSELCKHLADKLKSAVERAQSFLHRRFLSLEDKAKYIDAFKLFYGLANMAVKVIRSCCQEEWIQAAFLMTNVPEHILSTSFDLEMLNHFFSGSLTSTEVLESIFKAEVAIVNMKASHDRESLVGDVYALLRRGESGSTETYRLASLTLEKLDPQRQNLGGSSSGAYRVDMESLKEMEQLGKGSFATVFKAMWLGVEVAKKTFYAPNSPDFEKEVSILARLSHPNIVSLLCYAEGKRESCMVMELMDGDLCGLIQKIMAKDEHRGSPFSMLEAVDLMLQVGRGMEYLHEMRIVHRDLKAMNILVKQVKGKDGRSWYIWAKVADFGLSKTKHNSVTYSNQTLNTGTTRWMAPEMIKESVNEGQEQVSNVGMTAKYPFGGDVYSFAMVCYEILTGDVPFYDIAQPNAVKRMVLKGDRGVGAKMQSARPRFDEICVELRNVKCQLLRSLPHCELTTQDRSSHHSISRPKSPSPGFEQGRTGGMVDFEEFESVVEVYTQLEHMNLVKLISYVDVKNERLLVIEYVPNGNLRQHLDGIPNGIILDMSTRLNIAIDVAEALTCLHYFSDRPIIHRDVKPSNILLSDSFRAKVAISDLSRFGPSQEGATIIMQIMGTIGYLDPEYIVTWELNVKIDVYSFGILLLELFTGRRPFGLRHSTDELPLERWAFKYYSEGWLRVIIDPKLQLTAAALLILERVFELAFSCSAPTKVDRPNMREAKEMLCCIREEYQLSVDRQQEGLEAESEYGNS